jgi:hypothetical protein
MPTASASILVNEGANNMDLVVKDALEIFENQIK